MNAHPQPGQPGTFSDLDDQGEQPVPGPEAQGPSQAAAPGKEHAEDGGTSDASDEYVAL